jgi:23S rRNA pseudouridine1911/1915/1917 synthase
MADEHRPEGAPEVLTLRVEEKDAGERLDVWLSAHTELSRTRVARLVEEERVKVDGLVPRKSQPVQAGEEVVVTVPPAEPASDRPEDIPIGIVYEDSALVVVDKPAGMVVHPAPGHPGGTLVNALLHHVGDLSGIGGALRPGIVHRLDRDTSGLLVVAKKDGVHQALSRALKERKIRRRYLAAAWGHLPESPLTVDAPIGRDPGDRRRMTVIEGGRNAVTRMRVKERWLAAELLEVALQTGRTHQIRVHLAHRGHPVVGDELYGAGWERGMSGKGRVWARELAARVPRHFLHAAELDFRHPESGRDMEFRSPLPADLAAVAEWAGSAS